MLLKAVDKSRRSIRSSAQSRNFTIAIRLSLILMTDLLTWLPIYVLFASALNDGQLNIFTLQFAIILAIPLNSSINPYIYTATGTVCFNRLLDFIRDASSWQALTTRGNKVTHSTSLTKDKVSSNKLAQLPIDELKADKEINTIVL